MTITVMLRFIEIEALVKTNEKIAENGLQEAI